MVSRRECEDKVCLSKEILDLMIFLKGKEETTSPRDNWGYVGLLFGVPNYCCSWCSTPFRAQGILS